MYISLLRVNGATRWTTNKIRSHRRVFDSIQFNIQHWCSSTNSNNCYLGCKSKKLQTTAGNETKRMGWMANVVPHEICMIFLLWQNRLESNEIIIRTFIAKVLCEYLNLVGIFQYENKETFFFLSVVEMELMNTAYAIFIQIDSQLKCFIAIFICSMSSTFAPLKRFNQAVCPSLNP